jgi:hypothetical protein
MPGYSVRASTCLKSLMCSIPGHQSWRSPPKQLSSTGNKVHPPRPRAARLYNEQQRITALPRHAPGGVGLSGLQVRNVCITPSESATSTECGGAGPGTDHSHACAESGAREGYRRAAKRQAQPRTALGEGGSVGSAGAIGTHPVVTWEASRHHMILPLVNH